MGGLPRARKRDEPTKSIDSDAGGLDDMMEQDTKENVASLARGVRLDLVIAVCALLVSTLATAASWWQTRVIQQQLSAQVWPYVSIDENLNQETVQVSMQNDGLGPAIIRSATVSIGGKPVTDLVAAMHAILGPNIVQQSRRRGRHGETLGLTLNSLTPGSVLRVGDPTILFALRSKPFAASLMRGFERLDTRICYCALLPNTCWLYDRLSTRDPQPLAACPEVPGDLLHSSGKDTLDALTGNY